ncbi:hypothetical protein B0H34DRAFT_800196 [Crassisporium funariophilum]|nr:hypothetical protein B0H34DRAFT_800196 [Crassisporium funariophilum]
MRHPSQSTSLNTHALLNSSQQEAQYKQKRLPMLPYARAPDIKPKGFEGVLSKFEKSSSSLGNGSSYPVVGQECVSTQGHLGSVKENGQRYRNGTPSSALSNQGTKRLPSVAIEGNWRRPRGILTPKKGDGAAIFERSSQAKRERLGYPVQGFGEVAHKPLDLTSLQAAFEGPVGQPSNKGQPGDLGHLTPRTKLALKTVDIGLAAKLDFLSYWGNEKKHQYRAPQKGTEYAATLGTCFKYGLVSVEDVHECLTLLINHAVDADRLCAIHAVINNTTSGLCSPDQFASIYNLVASLTSKDPATGEYYWGPDAPTKWLVDDIVGTLVRFYLFETGGPVNAE